MVSINIEEAEIWIEMLGGFVLKYGENRITEKVKRSSKLWKLLQYLITHRFRQVSQEELIENFFESEIVGNPGSALRTMIYRTRAALLENGLPFADDMILSKSGGYSWNNSIKCTIDTEQFEALCKKAGACTDQGERLELLTRAADLYKGDFLPKSSSDMWVIPQARWYRSLYIECVHDALELLADAGRNAEVEELCVKALRLDQFDEIVLEHHLRSLLAQGKNVEALEEYKKMETLFYDVMGVNFSDNLRALYTQIQRPSMNEGVALDAVLEEWVRDIDFPGAFYCDLSEFRVLYQIETRSVPRSGRTAYIVRIDTKPEVKAKGSTAMKQLKTIIPDKLRMGDLYTQASPSQFMIMLHSLTYENCKDLVNRILYSLDAKHLPKIISTTIRPVKPLD